MGGGRCRTCWASGRYTSTASHEARHFDHSASPPPGAHPRPSVSAPCVGRRPSISCVGAVGDTDRPTAQRHSRLHAPLQSWYHGVRHLAGYDMKARSEGWWAEPSCVHVVVVGGGTGQDVLGLRTVPLHNTRPNMQSHHLSPPRSPPPF
jgi:hypothetical protein